MKKLLTIATLASSIALGFSQGTVDFRNGGISFATIANRLVYDVDGTTPLVGTNFMAQLYWVSGAGSVDARGDLIGGLTATGNQAPFRPSTTTLKGIWNSGVPTTRGIGVNPGGLATLQVKVWDRAFGTSFETATQSGGGKSGRSAIFQFTVPQDGSPPPQYYMENFQTFALVPEPSTVALAILGGSLGLLLIRRRKQ